MILQYLIFPFLLTMLIMPVGIKFFHYLDMLDHPDTRKVHDNPIPASGGVIFYLSFMACLVYFVPMTTVLKAYILGVSFLVVVGLVDDIKPLSPNYKFLAQIIAAFIFLSITKIHLDIPYLQTYPLISLTVGTIFIVGITNSINLIDGLDGLASGISIIAASTLSLFFVSTPYLPVFLILIAVVFGFLRANTFPASIFMGDSGSYFLGYTLAIFSLVGVGDSLVPLWFPLLVLFIPILDTNMVFFKRLRERRPIFKADKNHIHHRIQQSGISHKNTVFLLYSFKMVFALSAILLTQGGNRFLPVSLILLGLLTLQHVFLILREDLHLIPPANNTAYLNIFKRFPVFQRAYVYYFMVVLIGLSMILVITSRQPMGLADMGLIFIAIITAFLFIIDNNAGRTVNVSIGMIILAGFALIFAETELVRILDWPFTNVIWLLLLGGITLSSMGMFKSRHFFDSPTEYLLTIVLLIYSQNHFSMPLATAMVKLILLFLVYKILLQDPFIRRYNVIYVLNIITLCLMVSLNI